MDNSLDTLVKEFAKAISEEVMINVREGLSLLSNDHNKLSPNTDPLVSQSEICKFLDISQPTLVKMRKRKEIPYKRVGRKFLYNKSDVSSAIEMKGGAR